MSLNLHPGEHVLFEGHPSWRAILGFYLKGFLVAVILGVIAKLIDGGATTFLVILVVLALTLLIGFAKRVATTYTITDRRLNIKRGIISKEVQETRLERVQNVNYRQSVYQRLMQIGDVDFDTAGTEDSDFAFVGVSSPRKVVEAVDKAQRQREAALADEPPPAPAPTDL
jgi:uncharacterized membrane protein YdbT with pleckstrin-like domain